MANSKPLSYEALKTALQHLEANKRFDVAKCCPSIRIVEKIVPLKLDSLDLNSFQIKVNDTKYEIGACARFREDAPVKLSDWLFLPFLAREEDIGFDYVSGQPGVIPVYKNFNQLNITSSDSRRIERFEKSGNLSKPMKYLTDSMFGERRHLVHVKNLRFKRVLCLPPALKFKIRELNLGEEVVDKVDVISHFIDNDTLEVLQTTKQLSDVQVLSHPLELTARKLVLYYNGEDLMLRTILKLAHKEIHLKTCIDLVELLPMFQKILEDWMKERREVGRCFSFTMYCFCEFKIMDVLNKACREYGGKKIGTRSVKVPYNDISELDVKFQLKDNFPRDGIVSITVVPIN